MRSDNIHVIISPQCISALHSTRNYSSNVRKVVPALRKGEFFNREQELKKFREILRGSPQCSLILGPKNSGKTALLTKVLAEEVEANRRPIISLDLRELSFNTVNGFTVIVGDRLLSWIDQFQEQAPKHVGGILQSALQLIGLGNAFSLNGIERTLKKESKEINPVERLTGIFDQIDRHLPVSKENNWDQTPILFIDEANKLTALLEDNDGKRALTNFFDWIAKSTKQTRRFHAVGVRMRVNTLLISCSLC